MKIELDNYDNIDLLPRSLSKELMMNLRQSVAKKDYGKLARARGNHREIKRFIEEIVHFKNIYCLGFVTVWHLIP